MTALAQATGIHRVFGDVEAITDFNVTVTGGSIIGLIGPSGSGKTTAVRLMAGLDRPTSGRAELFGRNAMLIGRRDRARLAFLAQDPALIDELSIEQQVRFAAKLRGTRGRAVREILDVVDLASSGKTRLSDASGGMRRRTGLAAALVSAPQLAFLDEPTAGLDPIVRDRLWQHFRDHTNDGKALVVTTQHIDEAARCDRVLILQSGSVVADEAPHQLIQDSGLSESAEIEVAPHDREKAIAAIRAGSFPLDAVYAHGETTIRIDSADAGAAAALAADVLAEAAIELLAVDTFTPSLDEVFRSIVGNS